QTWCHLTWTRPVQKWTLFCSARTAQHEARRVEQGAHGLGVGDLTGADAGERLGEGEDDGLEELVAVEGGGAGGEVEREEEVDALVAEARGGEDAGEPDEAAGDEAGLLLELAARADLPVLAWLVRPAGGYFEEVAAGRVAVLADEHDTGIGRGQVIEDGERGGGARVADELELAGRAVGEADGIHGQVHDAAAVDGAPGQQPRCGGVHGVLVHRPVWG